MLRDASGEPSLCRGGVARVTLHPPNSRGLQLPCPLPHSPVPGYVVAPGRTSSSVRTKPTCSQARPPAQTQAGRTNCTEGEQGFLQSSTETSGEMRNEFSFSHLLSLHLIGTEAIHTQKAANKPKLRSNSLTQKPDSSKSIAVLLSLSLNSAFLKKLGGKRGGG